MIKKIAKPIEKKFIKQLEKTEYDGKVQNTCNKVFVTAGVIGIISLIGTIALEAVCPPVATALLAVEMASGAAIAGSEVVSEIKSFSEYVSNKEFNEQKVIYELNLEED